jgi:la-related protein 1
VIFGSIGAPEGSKSSSPAPPPSGLSSLSMEDQSGGEKPERAAMTFSIGVAPGEAGPSHVRSRTRSQPRLSHPDNTTDGKEKELELHAATEAKVEAKVADQSKWEFGTANRPQDEPAQGEENRPELSEASSQPLAPVAPLKSSLDVSLLFSGPLQGSSLPVSAAEPPLAEMQHPYPPTHHPIPYILHGPPLPPPQEELHVQTGPGPYPVHQPPSQPLPSSGADGFEVKDFGYGFGRASGTGHSVSSSREERLPREREWERNREVEREPYWRPRGRGSYNGHGHHERGAYVGRRGRGANGFGRGLPGRGFGRGGFRHQHFNQHQHQHQQQHQQSQHQKQQQPQHQQQQPPPPQQQQQHHQQQQVQQPPPPYNVTPPAQPYQPLQPSTPPPRAPTDMGQYGTTIQQPYMSHGFDAYQTPIPLSYPPATSVSGTASGHPLPRPLSNLTFPLDPTRYYLLGQLEYYLSAQNLVSDIFLRQRVIALFASWIAVFR